MNMSRSELVEGMRKSVEDDRRFEIVSDDGYIILVFGDGEKGRRVANGNRAGIGTNENLLDSIIKSNLKFDSSFAPLLGEHEDGFDLTYYIREPFTAGDIKHLIRSIDREWAYQQTRLREANMSVDNSLSLGQNPFEGILHYLRELLKSPENRTSLTTN